MPKGMKLTRELYGGIDAMTSQITARTMQIADGVRACIKASKEEGIGMELAGRKIVSPRLDSARAMSTFGGKRW